jgi:hypothetical protein
VRGRTLASRLLVLLAVVATVYVIVDRGDDGDGDQAVIGLPADGVAVYYFHGTKRCQTCNRMEALADRVITERFGDRRHDGTVVFRSIDLESAGNGHFVDDFALVNRVVVMVPRRGGEDLPFRRLDEVWERIADADAYQDYIAENLAACLRDAGLDEG